MINTPKIINDEIFTERESNVRSYCRSFPAVFERAKGDLLYTEDGEIYLDFLAGAGALNYGHNNDAIKQKILDYLSADGLAHGLDLHTTAKRDFLERFAAQILRLRGLDYKVQFSGPTGTNAVEAALKLARKVTRRPGIFSFMGGYHGMSLGSLAVTANRNSRAGAGVPMDNVTFMPYPCGPLGHIDTIAYMHSILSDGHSGIEKPAALIVETVQAEGGVVVAPAEWLRQLRALCDQHEILLICDDIQVGCWRTGTFFSFERAGIVPDMVILSKSISGYGLPMSLLLMRPELDMWAPAEHTGTFRGNQLAFVGATAALEYAAACGIEQQVRQKEQLVARLLRDELQPLHPRIEVRGIGLIWGVDLSRVGGGELASSVAQRCFELGLVVERVGRNDSVIKLLPPLTIDPALLRKGCFILKEALASCLEQARDAPSDGY